MTTLLFKPINFQRGHFEIMPLMTMCTTGQKKVCQGLLKYKWRTVQITS